MLIVTACPRPGDARPLPAALDEVLARNGARHGIAGQAVLVLHDGAVVYRGAHGFADVATRRAARTGDVFPVYSVAKLFASVLVLQLVERGVVDLDAPASRHVPDLPPAWRAITVRDLLCHVSGLPDYFDPATPARPLPATIDAVFAALADRPLLFAAGEETRYNQVNYLILAALLERHHRAPYRAIVAREILAPLGLRDTYLGLANVPAGRLVTSYRGVDGKLAPDLVIPWRDYAAVHAELYTTVDDLGAFLTAVAAGRLVRHATLDRAWRRHRGSGWAGGWELETIAGFRAVGHDGGTKVRARLLVDDDFGESYVFVYLTNGSAANVWSRTLVDSVGDVVLRGRR